MKKVERKISYYLYHPISKAQAAQYGETASPWGKESEVSAQLDYGLQQQTLREHQFQTSISGPSHKAQPNATPAPMDPGLRLTSTPSQTSLHQTPGKRLYTIFHNCPAPGWPLQLQACPSAISGPRSLGSSKTQ